MKIRIYNTALNKIKNFIGQEAVAGAAKGQKLTLPHLRQRVWVLFLLLPKELVPLVMVTNQRYGYLKAAEQIRSWTPASWL